MLPSPSPFPNVGSRGYLRPTGAPVTILRRNADGTVLVRRDPDPVSGTAATDRDLRGSSGNTTVPHTDVCESRDAAIERKKRREAA